MLLIFHLGTWKNGTLCDKHSQPGCGQVEMEQHRHTNNAPGMVSLTVLNSRPPVVWVGAPHLWQHQGHGLPGM